MNKHIYGIHDAGGAHVLQGKGTVVQSEAIGAGPGDWDSKSYQWLVDLGLEVLVRLNNAYHPNGTLPLPAQYEAFAKRCGNYVEGSQGCHIWVIGNEPNLSAEWPWGQPITPVMYAQCFRLCRREIRSRPGHERDKVLVAAVGPWNIETGPWIDYFSIVLWELNPNAEYGMQLDGIALHTYSRGSSVYSITDPSKMDPPYGKLYSGFQTYRDWMEAIPEWARDLPVYITETDQNEAWLNRPTGWVQEAYEEINRWNQQPGAQQIRCLVLYRWEKHDQWAIEGKQSVIDDLHAAIAHGYVWSAPEALPLPEDEPEGTPLFLAQKVRWWIEEETRAVEKGDLQRANDIRYSLIKLDGGLLYRLERRLEG